MRMLLERNDVDPNTADTKYGLTPLSWAAGNGHEAIVKILLERSNINSNTLSIIYGQIPLLWVAGNGHERIFGLPLELADLTSWYTPNLLSTEHFFPESSKLSEPPSKRTRRF